MEQVSVQENLFSLTKGEWFFKSYEWREHLKIGWSTFESVVSNDQNANISCCNSFKALPFLDRKLISRSHEKVLWSWGLSSYNWRAVLDFDWANKSAKNKERQSHTHQKKRRFSLSWWTLDQDPESFMCEFMLCTTETLISFPVWGF